MDPELIEERKKLGMDNRTAILHVSLMVEHEVSMMVLARLGIEDASKGKPFKNLKFDAHINLLFALDVLEDPEKERLEWFKDIRNILIHRIEATSLVKCFQILSAQRDKLLEAYKPDKQKSEEERLFTAITSLMADIATILKRAKAKIIEEETDDRMKLAHYDAHMTYQECIPKALKELQKAINARIESNVPFTNGDIQSIPQAFDSYLNAISHKTWREKAVIRFGPQFLVDLAGLEAKQANKQADQTAATPDPA